MPNSRGSIVSGELLAWPSGFLKGEYHTAGACFRKAENSVAESVVTETATEFFLFIYLLEYTSYYFISSKSMYSPSFFSNIFPPCLFLAVEW